MACSSHGLALGLIASEPSAVSIRTLPPKAASHSRGRVVCRSANQANRRRSLMVLVWVLYACICHSFPEPFWHMPKCGERIPCLLPFGGGILEALSGISPIFLRQANQHSW